jgi:hypothetical protein
LVEEARGALLGCGIRKFDGGWRYGGCGSGARSLSGGEVLNTFNVLNHFYGGKISMGYILKAFRTT